MKTIFGSKNFRELLRVLLALFIGLGLGFIITCFVSKDPVGSYKAFLFGPLTQLNRIGDWLEESTTLIFLGLAVALVFAAKQFYIGVEGQMVLGALGHRICRFICPIPACDSGYLSVLCSFSSRLYLGSDTCLYKSLSECQRAGFLVNDEYHCL